MISEGAQLLGGRPQVFTAWQHPYTFTCPCRADQPPPLLFLILFYNTPNCQQRRRQPLTLAYYST